MGDTFLELSIIYNYIYYIEIFIFREKKSVVDVIYNFSTL
ncbi:hypothetical protein CCP2SC5_650006 [Azospirillaceae bacterium]